MAKKADQPVTLSRAEFARVYGYGAKRIQQLARTGPLQNCLVRARGDGTGKADMELNVEEALKVMELLDRGKGERASKDHYEGLIKKLQYERETGELVRGGDMDRYLAEVVHVFARAIDNYPARVSALGANKDEVKLHAILTREADKMRLDIIDGLERVKERMSE